MRLTLSPITESEVHACVGWRYEAPYDVYNIVLDDEEMREHLQFCLDPANGMHAIRDDRGDLVGFCVFGPDARIGGGDYSQEDLDIGLGLRPDHTGKGLGVVFAEAVVQFAQATYRPVGLRVTILAYNQRAQRVWQRLGFTMTQEFVSTHAGRWCVVLRRGA